MGYFRSTPCATISLIVSCFEERGRNAVWGEDTFIFTVGLIEKGKEIFELRWIFVEKNLFVKNCFSTNETVYQISSWFLKNRSESYMFVELNFIIRVRVKEKDSQASKIFGRNSLSGMSSSNYTECGGKRGRTMRQA